MTRALVHIGLHKTGSTYLQNLMKCALDGLGAQGIAIPEKTLRQDIRALLAENLEVNKRFSRSQQGPRGNASLVWTPVKLEEQLELIGPDKHLLITEEAYEALGRFPATLEDFERILRARVTDVNYMVVVRQFADHAASMLQQQAKTFQLFHYRQVIDRLAKYSLDQRLGAFADLGKPLTVFDFETIVKGDTCSHLSNWIAQGFGTEPIVIEDGQVANSSLGQEGVAFMITLAHMIKMATGEKPPIIHKWPHFKDVQAVTVPAIRDHLRIDDRFYPFPEELQRSSGESARKRSKKTIKAFPGSWVNMVFREQTKPFGRVLVSDLGEERRRHLCDLILDVWSQIEPILASDLDLAANFDPKQALAHFVEHERELLL